MIETAVGCDRLFLTFLCDAYREEVTTDDKGKQDTRVVLGLHPEIAPVKLAILPLSKKPELQEPALKIYEELSQEYEIQYDETASIGKRYRRQDEIGTPLCVTFDFESLEDKQVTIRHRDSMKQDRVAIDQLSNYIKDTFNSYGDA